MEGVIDSADYDPCISQVCEAGATPTGSQLSGGATLSGSQLSGGQLSQTPSPQYLDLASSANSRNGIMSGVPSRPLTDMQRVDLQGVGDLVAVLSTVNLTSTKPTGAVEQELLKAAGRVQGHLKRASAHQLLLHCASVQLEMEILQRDAECGVQIRRIAGEPANYTRLCHQLIACMDL